MCGWVIVVQDTHDGRSLFDCPSTGYDDRTALVFIPDDNKPLLNVSRHSQPWYTLSVVKQFMIFSSVRMAYCSFRLL